jgi:Mlc titration factor MtfA (ptsG expression regulator)
MFDFLKERRRKRLMTQPLPAELIAIIARNVPYYDCLSREEKSELEGLVQVFLDEKYFEGCGGLEMTDEIRVTIAAQACILLLGREHNFYPDLRTVLVYPYAYIAHAIRQEGWIVSDEPELRAGESWSRGTIVLSWDDVLRGASDIHDGRNVVFHEFAHQLDSETGPTNGAPELPERSMYIAWARVLGSEYAALIDSVRNGEPTLLDGYGATSPAEFFAVATEFFFERPVELRMLHPELYDQLKLFYRRDPAATTLCFPSST